MNYDKWKLEEQPVELDNECDFCGFPCVGKYCDKNCEKAYEEEN